ncbi:MAG: chemotaxis response regulator protein-glutamate methylesterase [Caldilineaceae bacterium]
MIRQEYSQKESISAQKFPGKEPGIRVITTDDSALIRLTLKRYLNQFSDIEVIGQASNGLELLSMVASTTPDVVVLDVEMPVMNGIEALEQLMCTHPVPVIMLSNLTLSGAEVTLHALELGAVDFVVKPQPGVTMAETVEVLAQKIRQAVHARVQQRPALSISRQEPKDSEARSNHSSEPNESRRLSPLQPSDRLLAVASSTGGPSALTAFLSAIPQGLPLGGVIIQHMPMGFTTILSQRLNRIGDYTVTEALTGSRLMRGQFLVAPGGYHLTFDEKGVATLNEGPTINGVRPSADVTFRSLAQNFASQITAVILTGMGQDGFAGSKEIRRRGGRVLAQDERSAVVFGMPRKIIESNLAEYVASPAQLGAYLGEQVVQ